MKGLSSLLNTITPLESWECCKYCLPLKLRDSFFFFSFFQNPPRFCFRLYIFPRWHHNTWDHKCNSSGLWHALCCEHQWAIWCGRQNQFVLERHNSASCTRRQAKRWILDCSRMLHVCMILSVVGLLRCSFPLKNSRLSLIWTFFFFVCTLKQWQRQQFGSDSYFWYYYQLKLARLRVSTLAFKLVSLVPSIQHTLFTPSVRVDFNHSELRFFLLFKQPTL